MDILKSIKNIFIPKQEKDSWVVISEQKSLGNWLHSFPDGRPDGLPHNKREVIVVRQIQNTYTGKVKFLTVIEWTDNTEYMTEVDRVHKELLAKSELLRGKMSELNGLGAE